MNDYMSREAKECTRICEYVLFGILIALFYYGKDFVKENPIKCLLLFILTIFSLYKVVVFHYDGYRNAKLMLDSLPTDGEYEEKVYKAGHKQFVNSLVFTAFSVVSFIVISYIYFFPDLICYTSLHYPHTSLTTR